MAWTAIEAKQLYPSAHFKANRGALVAAAQAFDILLPEDPQLRRGRSPAVIHESYRDLKNYHEVFWTLPDLSASENERLDDHLE